MGSPHKGCEEVYPCGCLQIHAGEIQAWSSGRFRKIHDPIPPVPFPPFDHPEASQQPRLVTIIRAANRAPKEHESTVSLASAEYLASMPGKRRAVERHQDQTALGAGDQQCGIIQAEPRPVLPGGDVDDGKFVDQTPARSNETVGCVLVSVPETRFRGSFRSRSVRQDRSSTFWRRVPASPPTVRSARELGLTRMRNSSLQFCAQCAHSQGRVTARQRGAVGLASGERRVKDPGDLPPPLRRHPTAL